MPFYSNTKARVSATASVVEVSVRCGLDVLSLEGRGWLAMGSWSKTVVSLAGRVRVRVRRVFY